MNDAVNVGVGLEDLVEAILLGDIKLDELGLLAADSLNTVEGLGGGVVQVISDDDLVASLEQGEGGEGANVTGTTSGAISWDAQWGQDGGGWGWGGGAGNQDTHPVTRTEPAGIVKIKD